MWISDQRPRSCSTRAAPNARTFSRPCEPYADAVYAAVVAFNATNAVVKACNEGLVHQVPRMVLAAIIPNVQAAISELLMAHPAVSVVDPKDVVNDVNSLLGLITSTMRAIQGNAK